MNNIVVLSPEVSKESAGILAEALGAKLEFPYKTENRDFNNYDYVFKYGFSKPIKAKKGCVFNKSKAVEISRDKVSTFNALKGLGITVDFTDDYPIARDWMKDGHTVVARKYSKESNGKGMSYCTSLGQLENTDAVFWTKCEYEAQELRVNLWHNRVISIYVKIKENDFFVFKLHKGMEEHPQLVNIANKVYDKIGLDFCGLDILNDKEGNLLLLEVNSAPILFPYTCNKLVACIKKEINK